MPTKDPRIDAYIEKAEDFAKPILTYLREVVQEACPDVQETIKWGFPHFMHEGILCSMASFKKHCAFGFWKGSLVLEDAEAGEAMGQFGRIESLEDLPPRDTLMAYVLRAVEMNESGIQPKKSKPKKPELDTPEDFRDALRARAGALEVFDAFPPSHRREYVEWIVDAKREETRRRRIEKAVDQIAESKSLNWKYM